jgi:hypothetical protein
VGRGKDFTVEEPVKCHLEKLIDGVRLVGKHDGDVTDLSISQWMSTRLASGSKDGTVRTKLTAFVIEYFAKLHSFDLNGTLSLLRTYHVNSQFVKYSICSISSNVNMYLCGSILLDSKPLFHTILESSRQ